MPRPRSAETSARIALQAKLRGQFFDTAKVRKQLERANYQALKNAGYHIKQIAKQGVGQNAPAKTKSGAKAVKAGAIVEFAGGLYRDLTMMSSGKPRAPGKPIKSWAPKRFMYYSIIDVWDQSRKSVVIGTYKAFWLARLHEFGGSLTLRAYRIGVGAARNALLRRDARKALGRDSKGRYTKGKSVGPRANQYEYGALLWSSRPLRKRNWEATTITKVARYPARPYMQGAARVIAAVAKIREKFRNTLKKAA